ncbi:MAG: endonuclease III [Methylovulum sp.]|nr:endonuclease III [Methylovulum sp.]
MNQQKRLAIFDRLAAATPEPTTELNYRSTFELLIAVVLSAQATDKGVNKATAQLFAVADTPASILGLGLDGLKSYIKTIGLFNSKAANIIGLCQQLLDKHDGAVPETRNELEALPGVGRKTANVILNTAFGQDAIAVDTHIFRVANRTRIAPGKNVREVEQKLDKWVPKIHKKDAHHLLILHGRYTCTARKPKCADCVLADLCEYQQKQPTAELKHD